MKLALVEKLTQTLPKPTLCEAGVVYALVQTRKLMELEGLQREYKTLNCHRDWAVHARLSGKFARKIPNFLEDHRTDFANEKTTVQDIIALSDITKTIALRKEFIDVGDHYEIASPCVASER